MWSSCTWPRITRSLASNSGPMWLATTGVSNATCVSEPRTITWLASGYLPFFSPKNTVTRPKSARGIVRWFGSVAAMLTWLSGALARALLLVGLQMSIGRAQLWYRNFCRIRPRYEVADYMIGFDRKAGLDVTEH